MKLKNTYFKTISLLLIIICSKIIPHPPNLSIAISLFFVTGIFLPRHLAVMVTLNAIIISDSLLAIMYGYPVLGWWSLFTYSGFICITLLGTYPPLHSTRLHSIFSISASALGFWIWTNFGVWLTNTIYPFFTLSGLIACYTAALPFLANDIFANSLFWLIAFCLIKPLPKTLPAADSQS